MQTNAKKIISVVGAGGKTTLIHRLAEEYRARGARVLVTTTTHMLVEEDTVLSLNPEDILTKIAEKGICMAGSRCEAEPHKMEGLPEELLSEILPHVDICLIEADGAKHYSLKYPNHREPVILPETTDIYVVMGRFHYGRPCGEVVFRQKLLEERFGVSYNTPVTEEFVEKYLLEAYREKWKAMHYEGNVQVIFSDLDEKGELVFTHREI